MNAQISDQAKDAAGQTAGTTKDEAAQTAQTAKHAAADTAGTAREEAAHVGGTAKDQVSTVVGTAKDQVSNVTGEAVHQVQDLTAQVRTQVSEQAGIASRKAAQALRSLAEELESMTHHDGPHGAATQAVSSLASRGHAYADYLEGTEPDSMVSDARYRAARRPGGFLLGAALAGVLTGRFLRGNKAAQDGTTLGDQVHDRLTSAGGSQTGATTGYQTTGYTTTTAASGDYQPTDYRTSSYEGTGTGYAADGGYVPVPTTPVHDDPATGGHVRPGATAEPEVDPTAGSPDFGRGTYTGRP